MKIPKSYYIWMALGLILLIAIELAKPKELDWRKTFSSYDKIPFGTSVLYELADSIFTDHDIERINKSLYSYNPSISYSSTFIFINDYVSFDGHSRDALFEHISTGNEVFISANRIDKSILDSLQIQVEGSGLIIDEKDLEFHSIDNIELMADTSLKMVSYDTYGYFNLSGNESNIEVLGKVNNKPNYIKVKFGEGYYFLHLKPILFTNYYLLKDKSTKYVEKVLLKLSDKLIVWDDYMNHGDRKAKTPLRVILNSEGFRYAYYSSVVILLLFMLFAGKRKQKAIPVIEEDKNKSVEFIETITNLYFGTKNHKHIAKHQINAFKLHIKAKYFIDWSSMDSNKMIEISRKSNIPFDQLNKLKELIESIEDKKNINQTELLNLTDSIQKFTHNKYGAK